MSEADPMGDTTEKAMGHLTLALTVAARFVEVHLHRRAREAMQAREQQQQVAREAQQQTRAEAAVVKYDLRDVGQKEWWDTAAVEQVAVGYSAARAYSHIDPELAGVARHMAGEIQSRYGIDANQLVAANEESTRAFLNRGIRPPELQLVDDDQVERVMRVQNHVDSIEQRGVETVAANDPFSEILSVLPDELAFLRPPAEMAPAEFEAEMSGKYGPDWKSKMDMPLMDQSRANEYIDTGYARADRNESYDPTFTEQRLINDDRLAMLADTVDTPAQMAEERRIEAQIKDTDGILTAQFGPNWHERADLAEVPWVGYTTANGGYGELSQERVSDARQWREATALLVEANVVESIVHADGVVTPREASTDLPRADLARNEAGRHEALATRLTAATEMPPEAKEARLIAATAQATPAAAATSTSAAALKAPKARSGADQGAERMLGR